MFWVKAIMRSDNKVLVVDTTDASEEWHNFSNVKALIQATGIQILGVFYKDNKFYVRAVGDPRDLIYEGLKRYQRYLDAHKVETGLEVRDFGHWEVPYDAKQEMLEEMGYIEDDYDWKEPTQETINQIEDVIRDIENTYGYRIAYEVGEKNWLYFKER